jgi:hypothetical protein
VTEPHRSPDWALVPAKPAQGLNTTSSSSLLLLFFFFSSSSSSFSSSSYSSYSSSSSALQLFIEFWPSQPTLSIFSYLGQEPSGIYWLRLFSK